MDYIFSKMQKCKNAKMHQILALWPLFHENQFFKNLASSLKCTNIIKILEKSLVQFLR